MWDDDETLPTTPIGDDAWPEEALLATMPPSEVALWRAARRAEEVAR